MELDEILRNTTKYSTFSKNFLRNGLNFLKLPKNIRFLQLEFRQTANYLPFLRYLAGL